MDETKQSVEAQDETKEEQLEETQEDFSEEEEDTEDSEEQEDESEVEKLRQENAKYKRLLKKQSKPKDSQEPLQETDNDLSEKVSEIEVNQQKWNFGVENNLEPKVVNEIYNTLGRLPTAKEMKSPIVKGAISGAKKQFRAKDNTPGATKTQNSVINSDFGKLSKEEKQAQFAKMVKDKYFK